MARFLPVTLVVIIMFVLSCHHFFMKIIKDRITFNDMLVISEPLFNNARNCEDKLKLFHGILTKPQDRAYYGPMVCSMDMQFLQFLALQYAKQERALYLCKDVRSYRLSGHLCRDPSLEMKLIDEKAFRCLPEDYQEKACMHGYAEYPCSKYRQPPYKRNNNNNKSNMTISSLDYWRERGQPYEPTHKVTQEQQPIDNCQATTTNGKRPLHCEFPKLAGKKGSSSIGVRQLPGGQTFVDKKVLYHRADGITHWTQNVHDYLQQMIQQGMDISPPDYPNSHMAVANALQYVGFQKTTGIVANNNESNNNKMNEQKKQLLVFGSISPWVEVLALHYGAMSPVITVDYNPPISDIPHVLLVKSMSQVLQELDQYPFILSYSAIEHDGQGRYGDPLDPDGDLAALKEIWLKLEPGGTLLLNVPLERHDNFFWYSARYYGPSRLPLLFRGGWKYGGMITSRGYIPPHESFHLSTKLSQDSPIFLLTKPLHNPHMYLEPNKIQSELQCHPNATCHGIGGQTTS